MRLLPLALVVLVATACGGGEGGSTNSPVSQGPTSTAPASTERTTATAPRIQIRGERTQFAAGGNGAADLKAVVNARLCDATPTLFGRCAASTGTGGAFVVTFEGNKDNLSEYNVVVRCGLDPAVPAASAKGTFLTQSSDLGLDPYGEVLGVTLHGTDATEAVLVYQPHGSSCPVIWGLGAISETSLFTGGLDRLSGEKQPIRFTTGAGIVSCASADGKGGIAVKAAPSGKCS